MTVLSKTADHKGRVTLGKEFADRPGHFEEVEEGVVEVTLAESHTGEGGLAPQGQKGPGDSPARVGRDRAG